MNKKRAPFAAALALVMAAGLSCRSNHVPDAPAVPAGPEYCLKDSIYTFKTAVTDPDGDSMAVRFDWDDSTVSHWVGWYVSGETVALTHAWSDTGDFVVRVLAQDRRLLTSDSSKGHRVLVALRRPPATPASPLGPDFGGLGTSYKFTAGAAHPDNIPVATRFAWGDGDTSAWSEFVPSGGPVSAKHYWSEPDTYAVTAQAKDTGELMSPWSSPHTIIIQPPGWSQLLMVGAPMVTPDSSGFLIRVVNGGSVDLIISFLDFYGTPDSAYMRDFRIDADHCGYPIPDGLYGTGPGDTVRFTAPVTVAPDRSQMVELYFGSFYVDEVVPPGTRANVHSKQFVFRFSDGSVITANP